MKKWSDLGHRTLAIKICIFYFFLNYPKANLETWVRVITLMVIVNALVWGWAYYSISEKVTIYKFLKQLFQFDRTRFETMVTVELAF